MDEQLLSPSQELAKLLTSFVCVRVVDMTKVNLDRFRFDYDLTFAMTTHFADGRSMSRFGGRNEVDPQIWLKPKAILNWLKRCLKDHQLWLKGEPIIRVPKPRAGQTIMDVKAFSIGLRGQKVQCVHCHSVLPALRRESIRLNSWNANQRFVYPDPMRIGLQLDPDRQTRVKRVTAKSPAKLVGLRPEDEINSIGAETIRSIADIQYALHRAPFGRANLPMTWTRNGELMKGVVKLSEEWKTCSPLEYAWRPMKWELSPAPGFGGQVLSAEAKRKLKLDPEKFALRIDYLVDWGPRALLGKNAKSAGLRLGDILLSVDGKRDFKSGDHLHSWVRLKYKVGQSLSLNLMRHGKPLSLNFTLVEG